MGGNKSARSKKTRGPYPSMTPDQADIRGRCAAALSHSHGSAAVSTRARRYIRDGKSPDEVGELLLKERMRENGPDIDTHFDGMTLSRRLCVNSVILESLAVQDAYDVISNPKMRSLLLDIIDRGVTTDDDRDLWLRARGIYSLVCRDSIDDGGRYPKDIDDYLLSKAWVEKFKVGKRGRPRQPLPEYCAIQLAYWFRSWGIRNCWGRVAEIIHNRFSTLSIPGRFTKSELSEKARRRRWAKDLAKRYARWAQQFRPVKHAR